MASGVPAGRWVDDGGGAHAWMRSMSRDAVAYMASLPLKRNVLTMTVMATQMPFVGRG